MSAEPDLVTSCSAADWPVELEGGPGGSDAAGALRRDIDRLAGSPSWHGLARCGGWHGLATCVGSPVRAARRIAARPKASRPIAAPKGGPIAAPASLPYLPMWQGAKMTEMSARVAALRVMAAAATVGAARGRAA
eukprot:scaffold72520_cov43-Phaeocystis_antarctica.AAC.2